MTKMDFSVAMSVYGKDDPGFFDRALSSITDEQTLKPSQIVLVADGPLRAELDAVIEKYQKKYGIFKIIRLPENRGLGNALKLALENADFELVARMDSDDVSLPTRFEKQVVYFEKDSAPDVVGGDISEFIGEEKNIVAYRRVPTDPADIRAYLKKRCPFNHMTVMYKKSAVLSAGGYLDLHFNEDYYLWIRMQLAGATFANTGTVLVNVRTGSNLYARRGGKRYFQSEKYLQKFMLEHKMMSRLTYAGNVTKRWIVQCCLPNRMRGWVFRTFARKQK